MLILTRRTGETIRIGKKYKSRYLASTVLKFT